MPVLLAIETSQRIGGVALGDISAGAAGAGAGAGAGARGGGGTRDAGENFSGGSRIDCEMLAPKKRHDDDLLPAIDRLLIRCGVRPKDLQAVAVSIGPGGFTGLRIAVATAKMFAETLGAKLVAVPSALVVAESLSSQRSEVGGQRSEVGDQRSEDRDQRSEVRDQRSEVGDQRSEVRSQKSEIGDQRSEVRDQRSEVGGQSAFHAESPAPSHPLTPPSHPFTPSPLHPLTPSPSHPLTPPGSPGSPAQAVIVALASKNDTFWSTRLKRINDEWAIVGTPGIASAQSLDLAGVAALVGDEHLPAAVRGKCQAMNVPVIEPLFDPRACLAAGARMLERGQTIDPLLLSPMYPREPEAVSLWERRERK